MATEQELQQLRDHVAAHGISSDDLMKRLSNTAKAVGSCFGMMRPGEGEMTFQMIENRPSAKMQEGLDELVAAGVIRREALNSFGGVRYVPMMNCSDFTKWMAKNIDRDDVEFPISEPIPNAKH